MEIQLSPPEPTALVGAVEAAEASVEALRRSGRRQDPELRWATPQVRHRAVVDMSKLLA